MTLVRCPRDGCEAAVGVDVEPGNLAKVTTQANVTGLDSVEVKCDAGHTFYVHH